MKATVTYAWFVLLSIIACLQKVNGGHGDTRLQVAVRNKDVDLVKRLLASPWNSTDVKATNKYGKTALMIAAGDGSTKIIELLLPNSDVKATNKNGNTALDIAKFHRYNQIVSLLQQQN